MPPCASKPSIAAFTPSGKFPLPGVSGGAITMNFNVLTALVDDVPEDDDFDEPPHAARTTIEAAAIIQRTFFTDFFSL
jgi:hypothetical protein